MYGVFTGSWHLCRSFLLSTSQMEDFALAMNNDATSPLNVSDHVGVYLINVTAGADDEVDDSALLPVEFVVVLVLAAACILVGVIYAYIHITRAARARIEKRKRRPSSFPAHHHSIRDTSLDEASRQTHLMFFRKTTSAS